MDISIIIPVYNAEQYLRECLDSALAQTVAEKEIICIDDGSTDGSNLILQEYQANYRQVRVLQQENGGAGKARNYGLEIAKGEFVCFLDADDYYLDETALEQMIQACRIHGVKACAALRKIQTEENKLEEFGLYREYFENKNGRLLNYFDYQDEYYYQNYIFLLEEIRGNHITFPMYRRYQDAPFFVNIMIHIKQYWILPVELYCYRFLSETYERKGKNIEDTLKGIRDNFNISQKYDLLLLKSRLIERLNDEYYNWIIANLNANILGTLLEINGILKNDNCTLRVLDDIKNLSKLQLSYQELQLSHYMMRIFLMISQGKYKFETYFMMFNINKLAIYGLGTFGKLLVNELIHSKNLELYGIDKSVKKMEGVRIGTLQEINNKCNVIVVTPLNESGKIVREIEGQWKGKIYILLDILQEIEKRISNGE